MDDKEIGTEEQQRYREQQQKQFYASFIDRNTPSHAGGEQASLPGPDQYDQPKMNAAQQVFLEQFQQYCSTLDAHIERMPQPDLSNCKVDYVQMLNREQLAAVTWNTGPLLVIAGAGTGKTWVICCRTAYLIEQGIPPEQILLLTFTRKAAREMIDRSAVLLQSSGSTADIHGGTFHGFANHMLRRYADLIGIDRNYTILDSIDSQDVISLIRDEMKITRKKGSPVPKSSVISTVISRARSCDITIKEVILKEYDYLEPYCEDIRMISTIFREYKQSHRQMDYDDLLEVFYHALKTHGQFRKKVNSIYRYIIIDEFQDTNLIQGKLVELLAGEEKQVMAVGDDAQSIYAFRGARHENILRFPAVFPECGIIKIQQNYRSSREILAYTNRIIESMVFGYRKILSSEIPGDQKPEVRRFFYQQDEASWICSRIEQIREKGTELSRIAVLFRSQYLSNYIQAEMLKRRIPFTVYGGLKFVERRHIKDMLAYLRIALNSLDAAAWNRILRLLPDIGTVRASLVIQTIMQNGGTFSSSSFSGYSFSSRLKELEVLLSTLRNDTMPLQDRILKLKQYYLPLMKTHCSDYLSRIPDLDVLAVLGGSGDSLEVFLSDLALDPPGSTFQEAEYGEEGQKEHVVLSTIHSAKGLEWDHVFIAAMLDGVFPDARSLLNIEELEEERRMFYVACTRAKRELVLTFPSYIQSYSRYFSLPSRFLSENRKDLFRFFIEEREQKIHYL